MLGPIPQDEHMSFKGPNLNGTLDLNKEYNVPISTQCLWNFHFTKSRCTTKFITSSLGEKGEIQEKGTPSHHP